MDFHKLQHTLFEMDPSDPREDLAKLKAQAQGAEVKAESENIDYLNESAEVATGSLELDKDYSINDFAALAGVRIDEKQKMGSAGQAKGKDPMPKAEPGRTKHPLKDKLVGEENSKVAELEERIVALENIINGLLEANKKMPTPRNPVAANAQRSGAGVHKDQNKKNQLPRKEKHKGKLQTESIKDMLYRKLAEKK